MKSQTEDENVLWTALFEKSGEAMVVLRQDGSVYRTNQRYADMLGYTPEEMLDLFVWDWEVRYSREEVQEMLLTVDNSSAHFHTRQKQKDGTVIDTELSNNGAIYNGEKLIFCIVRDITARKATEEQLRHNEQLLQHIASQVPGALYQYRLSPDGTDSFPYFSEGFAKLGGMTLEQFSDKDTDKILSRILAEDAADIKTKTQESARTLSQFHSVFRILHKDGSIRWLESRSTPEREPDGSVIWTGILLDVTQRVQAEEKIRAMAITDGLTGIINRQEFDRKLEHEIQRATRYHSPLSLIMYDLDHFKQINDHFGHNAGDEVLRTITGLVNDNIRSTDIHGRWGGEEFMVMLPQTGLSVAMNVAEKLRRVIAAHHHEHVGTVTASLGVVELGSEENSKLLAQRVDEALYRAKDAGRNRVEG